MVLVTGDVRHSNMTNLTRLVIVLYVIAKLTCTFSMLPTTTTTKTILITTAKNNQLSEFVATMEQLIMNTTDRALNVTQNVYKNWKAQMSDELCRSACPLMLTYIEDVDRARAQNASYTEKRMLFGRFRATNDQIEMLEDQLNPQATRFNYQLISEEFYNQGRNSTAFDNLYLDFMQRFEAVSQTLWHTMDESIVEQQQDFLEILDEISTEKELKGKDKLYDEFIELYLFKTLGNKP